LVSVLSELSVSKLTEFVEKLFDFLPFKVNPTNAKRHLQGADGVSF
jgi:hypothetical protein